MTDIRIGIFRTAMLALAGLVVSSPIQADELRLAPHAARYFVTGQDVRLPPEMSGLEGEALIRLERKCKSWLLFVRMDIAASHPQGGVLEIQSINLTEEFDDDAGLVFRTQQSVNGQVMQEFAGKATGSKVEYTDPEGENLKLPKGALFPVSAMRKGLEAFASGKKIFSYTYFNGDGVEAYQASDLLTGATDEELPEIRGDKSLLDGKMMKFVSTMYKLEQADSEPLYTVTSRVNEKGVSPQFVINSEGNKTTAILTDLETVPLPDCSKGT